MSMHGVNEHLNHLVVVFIRFLFVPGTITYCLEAQRQALLPALPL